MYSYGPLNMTDQKQSDPLEPTYSSSEWMRGVAMRTCRKRCSIGRGGERGSGIFVLMARQDDDDDLEKMQSSDENVTLESRNIFRVIKMHLSILMRLIFGFNKKKRVPKQMNNFCGVGAFIGKINKSLWTVFFLNQKSAPILTCRAL